MFQKLAVLPLRIRMTNSPFLNCVEKQKGHALLRSRSGCSIKFVAEFRICPKTSEVSTFAWIGYTHAVKLGDLVARSKGGRVFGTRLEAKSGKVQV